MLAGKTGFYQICGWHTVIRASVISHTDSWRLPLYYFFITGYLWILPQIQASMSDPGAGYFRCPPLDGAVGASPPLYVSRSTQSTVHHTLHCLALCCALSCTVQQCTAQYNAAQHSLEWLERPALQLLTHTQNPAVSSCLAPTFLMGDFLWANTICDRKINRFPEVF